MKGLLPLALFWAAIAVQAAASVPVFAIVNDDWRGLVTLDINEQQQPCLTVPLLLEWGLLRDALSSLSFAGNGCMRQQRPARHAVRYYYVSQAQVLTVLIPPEQLNHVANGVAASRWDDGINAAFVDYDLGYSRYSGQSGGLRRHSLEVSMIYGLNLDAWRFRYEPVWDENLYSPPRWHTEKAYAFRTLRSLRALFTLGDGTTSASLFDSVDYRGISLATDDRMLPDELRPFAPWIRGFARTEAEVKVRQYGTPIYQTIVPAGTFVLKDIWPMDPAADIEMTIKEEDGTETVRTLPYTAMPNLVRGNQWKYAFTAGRYRPWYLIEEQRAPFSQMTLSYGLPGDVSLYGGVMLSTIYGSAAAGMGKRFSRWGAASLDFSLAQADTPRRKKADRGTMGRVRYSKAFSDWESSISLTAQYYPARHYRTFSEAVAQQTRNWWEWEGARFIGEPSAEKKNALSLSYAQNFSAEDNFYLTLSNQTLRGRKKRDTQLEAGYSGSYGGIDYAAGLSWEHLQGEREQGRLTLSLAVPLKNFSLPHAKLNLENVLAKNGAASRKSGVSGTLSEDHSLGYSLSNTQEAGTGNSQKLSVSYQYNAGNFLGIHTRKKRNSTTYIGLTGSALLHQDGITPGQSLGETMALVEVPGTKKIGIINQYGTTTNSQGFAVIGNLTPFRVNELMLDTFSLAGKKTLPLGEMEIVPTLGAIMYSRFKAPVETPGD